MYIFIFFVTFFSIYISSSSLFAFCIFISNSMILVNDNNVRKSETGLKEKKITREEE